MAQRGGYLPGFDELEQARVEARMTVVAFCERLGIPRPTWYRWRAGGSSVKGPWPTPAQDTVEADAKALAAAWDAWGHRKLASLKRVGIDDIEPGPVSGSTMYRALSRNGLCLPVGYTGEVLALAGARRETFVEPPTRRNRLWQADFSEFETLGQGTWNLGGVVDYGPKVNPACTVTKTTRDAIAFLDDALAMVEVLLGVGWVEDLTDPDTGEIGTLKSPTTARAPASGGFAAWVAATRHIVHIRTRRKAPWTNGVIERFFEALTYERLSRHDISDGVDLAAHADTFRSIYNSTRPHEAIAMARPLERYRQTPTTNIPDPESVSNS